MTNNVHILESHSFFPSDESELDLSGYDILLVP